MNRQFCNSFSIDSLIAPSMPTRFGPMLYNNGYVYLPPSGGGLLSPAASNSPETPLTSALFGYAHSPYSRFPLQTTAAALFPAGNIQHPFGVGNLNNFLPYGQRGDFIEHDADISDRHKLKQQRLCVDIEEDVSQPKDLRVSTSSSTENEDIDTGSEDSDTGNVWKLLHFIVASCILLVLFLLESASGPKLLLILF